MNEEIRELYEAQNMDKAKENFRCSENRKGKKKRKNDEKRLEIILKSLSKQIKKMRKQQKLLKKAVKNLAVSETQKVEDIKKVEQVEHDSDVKKADSKERSFWRRFGDAVIKAVPSVLIQFVGKICSSIFKNGGFKPRWAVG